MMELQDMMKAKRVKITNNDVDVRGTLFKTSRILMLLFLCQFVVKSAVAQEKKSVTPSQVSFSMKTPIIARFQTLLFSTKPSAEER